MPGLSSARLSPADRDRLRAAGDGALALVEAMDLRTVHFNVRIVRPADGRPVQVHISRYLHEIEPEDLPPRS